MKTPDPLREIEEALSFQVSHDFCARVRQQVAAEPVRPRGLFGLPRCSLGEGWAIAAAVALAIGTGVVTSLRHLDVEVAQVSRPRPVDVASGPERPARDAAAVIAPVRPVSAMVGRHGDSVSARQPFEAYDTLVPDDQLHALDRLLAAMREGRATVPAHVADVVVNERGERVLRALALEPLTIELLAGTPAEPNKNPGKDPNK